MKAFRFSAWVLWVGVGLLVLLPVMAAAETPHTLLVTLRDVNRAGIVGATITVRDEAGTTDRAYATTDAQGIATFPDLTTTVVRVAVSGSLADGTPLNQRGQDAHGIWLLLDAPLVQLDLRSELNGAVVPDPASMISGDAPIPATTVAPLDAAAHQANLAPTNALMPTAVVIGVPTAIPFAAPPPAMTTIHQSHIGQGMVIIGTLILLILVGWFLRKRGASR